MPLAEDGGMEIFMQDRENLIEQVWKIELDILRVLHNVCVENGLKYTLAYGTLIGAIRHGGFIPWDDDIDIMMPRKDYNTLLKIWKDVAPPDYIIQDYNTDEDYTNNFAKVRKNNTTFLQFEEEKTKKYHKGIFIDIFPGDKVASGKLNRSIQYFAFAVNLLYSRGYPSGASGIQGAFERLLLSAKKENYKKIRQQAEKIMCRWNDNEMSDFVFPCTITCCSHYYPADMFKNLSTISFCGKEFYITKNYDRVLRIEYGDYMKLPPEEERVWKHHPLQIDFFHNYEELR